MDTKPITFNPPTQEAPTILLPVVASLFADRAERFSALAEGHSLADWLRFLGDVTRAQHAALQQLPPLELPPAATIEQALTHGMPPLNASALTRPAAWRDALRQIADALLPGASAQTRDILTTLRAAPDARLETLADALLKEGAPDSDAAAGEVPLVAAALQVVWTRLASQLDASKLRPLETPNVCPCCGSLPVGSVVRLGEAVNNLRYLHCSLCNSEWNIARATCTTCGDEKGLAVQQIEGSSGSMRAETCDSCKSYLKIAYQEKDPKVDPVADDLATLAIDLLVDEAGFSRSGPNLLLVNAAG